jgi:hypothetical protein
MGDWWERKGLAMGIVVRGNEAACVCEIVHLAFVRAIQRDRALVDDGAVLDGCGWLNGCCR